MSPSTPSISTLLDWLEGNESSFKSNNFTENKDAYKEYVEKCIKNNETSILELGEFVTNFRK